MRFNVDLIVFANTPSNKQFITLFCCKYPLMCVYAFMRWEYIHKILRFIHELNIARDEYRRNLFFTNCLYIFIGFSCVRVENRNDIFIKAF